MDSHLRIYDFAIDYLQLIKSTLITLDLNGLQKLDT